MKTKKTSLLVILVLSLISFLSFSTASAQVFFDNFENYTVGQRLACQDSIHWTTWSHLPCNTTEDALISSTQAFSPTKSVVTAQNSDLVKELGNATTGIHLITFKFYVPTGKAGYFNTLAGFAPSFPNAWAMEVYFDSTATGNNGRLTGGSATEVPFAYTHDSWQTMKLKVNLDIDSAMLIINGTVIHTWRWTAGTGGAAVPLRLAANDFFGATAWDQMYVDNYYYNPNTSWVQGVFFDDFEGYTVGQRLACQDPVSWTTWSHLPCNTTEDPLISGAQAFSPTKSVVITQNNDLVKELSNDTTGIHLITFKFYVPTGKAGYFNTLAGFAPSFPNAWAMEVYFDSTATGNNGRLTGGSATEVPFAYTHDSWQTMKLVVNLDIDSAMFVINGTVIHTWRWTAGTGGAAVPLRIAANDFFGATAWDEMYVDNYRYNPNASWIITGVTQNGNTVPIEYTLSQNYPNPFNPTTKINFALPKSGLVTLKVYDVLGKEVATLVNSNMSVGSYSFEFNASNLTSGIYFYRLESNGFSEVKKMMLIK
jgi:hypothetical protein